MSANGMQYNNPLGGVPSTVGTQITEFLYQRKALIEARKEQFFGQLADTFTMPKNHGKQIRSYVWIPLIDERNINSQGIDATGAKTVNGNLYGSSKDIGYITGKMPLLHETAGRVNRVGYTRQEISGTFEQMGFFSEYTEDSVNFDTEAQLLDHVNREMINGAMQLTEMALQNDLINNAGVVKYPNSATKNSDMVAGDIVSHGALLRLSVDLDNNRTPKQTKTITGTQLTDTKTIAGGRVMYIASDLIPMIESLKDSHGQPAFTPVHKYQAGTTLLNGEIGSISHFRLIVVPEMTKWAGAGGDATDDSYYSTNGKYDVYPMLVVGDGSFTTIGFNTNGKESKFKIIHKKTGEQNANHDNPYGKRGFMSISWWYGFMLLRGERIAIFKTLAKV